MSSRYPAITPTARKAAGPGSPTDSTARVSAIAAKSSAAKTGRCGKKSAKASIEVCRPDFPAHRVEHTGNETDARSNGGTASGDLGPGRGPAVRTLAGVPG